MTYFVVYRMEHIDVDNVVITSNPCRKHADGKRLKKPQILIYHVINISFLHLIDT